MATSRRYSFSAPGRAGILGNPSDIYGGFVLSVSTPARNYCTLEEGSEWELPDDQTLWNATVARVPIEGKWRVTWNCEVPRSSGLAGSTALLAATLACVYEAVGLERGSLAEFSEVVRDVELKEAGIVCGYQDAYMVIHGGRRSIDFVGKHPIDGGPLGKVQDVTLPGEFLLVTTGVKRLSGSVHGPLRDRWLSGERKVVDAMNELAGMARQAARGVDLQELGKAMTRNFEIVQSLGGSGEAVDQLVADCLSHGAISAKLAGAGMGGTVIALCDDPVELQRRLLKIGYSRFLRPGPYEGLRKEQ